MPDVWPASLPQRLEREGHSQGPADNRIKSQPETGPAKRRRRSTAAVKPLSGRMTMSAAQFTAFETFYEMTLAEGALPFTFPDPMGGSALLVRFSDDAWEFDNIGAGFYRVSLSLEVLP